MPKKGKRTRPTTKELTDHLQRLQAEFDNYRKRTEAERASLREALTEHLLRELLPVMDNFSLAIEHATTSSKEELLQGILMVREQLRTILTEHGVKEVPTNTTFDPTHHEAVQTVKDTTRKNNTITKTLQPGYTLGEKLLRPARVCVVKNQG